MDSIAKEKWYLRQHGEAIGPFPTVQIARYLLLQRLDGEDMISRDTQSWYPIHSVAEVQPDKLEKQLELPDALRRQLAATREWVAAHPQLFVSPSGLSGSGMDADLQQDYQLQQPAGPGINRPRAYALAIVLGLAVVLLAFVLPSAMSPDVPVCDAAPAPGVNWSNCLLQGSTLDNADLRGANIRNALLGGSTLRAANLEGADLAYTDLSLTRMRGARLVDANLTGANLRHAEMQAVNLQGADLRYANLMGVDLRGADLEGARMGYAIWEEDVICMPESVGQCIPGRAAQ